MIQTAVGSRRRRDRFRDANPRRDPATLPVPRASSLHRCQHRHRAGAAGRHRARSTDQERRSGDVCRQGRRTPDPPLLRAGHGRPRQGPAHHGAGSAPGDGRWRLRNPLPTATRSPQQRGDGLRGAVALAPSRTRHGLARGIHPAGGRHRPDQRARRLGAANRLRRGRDLAASDPACRQCLAGTVEKPDAGAADRGRAGGLRPRHRAGWRSKSPRRC